MEMKRGMNLTKLLVYLGLIIILLAFPLILNKYYLYILVLVGFFIMLACGLNLIFGYTGQISVCHGVFYAIGAYSSALLVLRLGWSFWLAMPVSVIITAIAAFLVGLPLLRTRG